MLVIFILILIVLVIGNVVKKGVLIKGGVYLEEMGVLKVIVFDKIGILIKGVFVVIDFNVLNK